MSRNSLLVRVRQVASPHKMARARLERIQKINKVSKSLFGPVIKNEFQRYAQMEMTKYQQQAANKWSFDFVNEAPIRTTKSQYAWDAVKINEAPKFYHHEFIAGPPTTPMQDDCENIWPLAAIRPTSSSCIANISSSPALIIHNSMVSHNRRMAHPVFAPASSSSSFSASTSSSLSNVCNKSQRKITDYLKVRKRRMSTSAVCLKKARADF